MLKDMGSRQGPVFISNFLKNWKMMTGPHELSPAISSFYLMLQRLQDDV